jgi:hypothetical protein
MACAKSAAFRSAFLRGINQKEAARTPGKSPRLTIIQQSFEIGAAIQLNIKLRQSALPLNTLIW